METAGKQTQVSAQIARQSDALAELADTVGKLDECLSSVLRCDPVDTEAGVPEQELVCLANKIRDNTQAIEAQIARLERIRSRLEL